MTFTAQTVDLTPSTRILQMLGEIRLEHWQCLAELIDNPVDEFLNAKRDGITLEDPSVRISLPTTNSPTAKLTVRDNGRGMSLETLNNAVRAGWSTNNPMDNLGLFGMGFNIATARLATKTVIYSARRDDPEWVGIAIDFDEMRDHQAADDFEAPVVRMPKTHPNDHGTIVEISNMKPEHLETLTRSTVQSKIRKRLARVYSSMLAFDGKPVGFNLFINNQLVKPVRHCVWSEERLVQTSKFGAVSAFMPLNFALAPRSFCSVHMIWLASSQTECPSCKSSEHVTKRERRITGWIGLQRYLSSSEFGIDFLRNGRKIETENDDLFQWKTDDGGDEPEYPIDDPRHRGRIVGEIHIDHCRVSYTKDHFDRTDPSWEEMVELVRGSGPLRPEKARELGFPPNVSPLFKLYNTFRRNSPKPANVAGAWAKILVVKDNDLAQEMAGKFQAGDPAYQTDEPWWQLVKEEDERIQTGGSSPQPPPAGGTSGTQPSDGTGFPTPGGFPNPTGFPTPGGTTPNGTDVPPAPTPANAPRTRVHALSREYVDDKSGRRFNVIAYSTQGSDEVLDGLPWAIKVNASNEFLFCFDSDHDIFRSVTFTPLDALLAELAAKVADSQRGTNNANASFSRALTSLRARYAKEEELSETVLTNDANRTLAAIAASLNKTLNHVEDARAAFNDLPKAQQDSINAKMLANRIGDPQEVISQGRFLEFAQLEYIPQFVAEHPELFFDGKYWEEPYATVDYGNPAATDARKRQIADMYTGWLDDAVWLAASQGGALTSPSRERLLRASMSLRLIAEGVAATEDA